MYDEEIRLKTADGSDENTGRFEKAISLTVRDIGIPPRPTVLDEIDREMLKDEPDFTHLANIVGSDVGLAASVIKVANSPAFGMSRRVRTVQDALLVLGLKLTVNTIANIVLKRIFPNLPSLERFWDSATRCARVSRWLMRQLRGSWGISPDDAYTFGLFRDCGIPLLMIPFPDYAAVLAQANGEKTQGFTDIENTNLGINHADLGAQLAADWRLPDEVVLAIQHHHDLGFFERSHEDPLLQHGLLLAAIALTADHLIQKNTGLSQDCEWEKLGGAVMKVLALTPERLDQLIVEAEDIASAQL